jgi:hypothetical protein
MENINPQQQEFGSESLQLPNQVPDRLSHAN